MEKYSYFKKNRRARMIGSILILAAIFIVIGLPILYAVLWSLVDPEAPWSLDQIFPSSLSLAPWKYIFKNSSIASAIINSFAIAVSTVIVTLILSLPTAYALGRKNLRGKEFFKIGMLLPMVFPGMALGLFLGRVFFAMGLSGSYAGVIMAHTLVTLPFMLRILVVSFESMPQDVIDAASNLGAGTFVKLKEIYLPLVMPGIVAGSIFTFINSVEEFNLTFIIGAPDIDTIPTVLFSYLGENFLRTRASVVSLIMLVPNLILLIITERKIKTEYMGAALGKM